MPDALIWGASGGIGRALTRALKAQGWRVFGAARDTSRVPAEADAAYRFAANDEASVKEIAVVLAHETQGLDAVVYAAGLMHPAMLADIGTQAWQDVMDANLNGAWLCTQGVLHLLRDGGHVVVLGAYADRIALPRFGAYAAAKAALEPLVTVLAKEQRKLNVSLVRPPAVDTPFWNNVPVSLPKGALAPETVADAIVQRLAQGGKGVLDL